MSLNLEALLPKYNRQKAEKNAKVEGTLKKVRDRNQKYADEAGMSLDDWHRMMSTKGNEIKPVLVKKTKPKYVPQTASEYVLNQVFPNIHGE